MIDDDCKAINTAGETKLAAEKVFIPIFTDRSRAHLAALISAYKIMFGKPPEKARQSKLVLKVSRKEDSRWQTEGIAPSSSEPSGRSSKRNAEEEVRGAHKYTNETSYDTSVPGEPVFAVGD
ncbi:hypothetical protein LWI28_022160 [Acer negundo]|uniref:Uncharacterized protein n=1 Tax=Acer negundo TaxID=4023 RepID=A0AAD5NNV2_ACENE|nr:hypothetical protein LWI28_022160 [Acer negundo]